MALTFATYLTNSSGTTFYRQRLAISSWLLSDPLSVVIIALSPTGSTPDLVTYLQSTYSVRRVLVSRDITVDKTGVPFVASLISSTFKLARSGGFCFINPNVIVDPIWYKEAVRSLAESQTTYPHLVGQRLDLSIPSANIEAHTIVADSFFKDLSRLFPANVTCIDQAGSEYFAWWIDNPAMAVSDIPMFKLGGVGWDLWLNTRAQRQNRVLTFRRQLPVYYIGDPVWDSPAVSKWNLQIAQKDHMKEFTAHVALKEIGGGRPRNTNGILVPKPVTCAQTEAVPVIPTN
jgi:hypothetical protein